MGRRSDLDEKPTRKRPLQIQVSDDDGALVIVLVGPHDHMRSRLFTRLGHGPGVADDDHRFRAASFELGGCTIDLIDWHSTVDPLDSFAVLGKASFALCIDPAADQFDEAFRLFVDPLAEGLFANACVALISDGTHLDSDTEHEWVDRLQEAGGHCTVYRVNCSDPMSPELFAKLFLSDVRDCGDDDHGIVVRELEDDSGEPEPDPA